MSFCYQGYNGIIKKTITFRERLPLSQFTVTVLKMAADLSIEYRKGERVIATEPKITIDDWRKSVVWADDKTIDHMECESDSRDEMAFIVSSSKGVMEKWELNEDNVTRMEHEQWKNFDDFCNFGSGFYWKINLVKDDWKSNSTCDCPFFLKRFKCKHVIGLALRTKIVRLPRAAIPTPIGEKAKRGRKKQAVKAMLTQ